MIGLIALTLMLAHVLPTPSPAPLVENQAPVPMRPAPFATPAVPGIDRTFAAAAVAGNNAELEFAQLALRRSNVPEVRSFAQMMLTDHRGLADAMMPELTRVLGVPPPATLPPPDLLALAHLQAVSAVDFDQLYLLTQVGDHLATLTAFQTEADNGTDPALKALARKWTPTIQAHLELAVKLSKNVGGSSPLR